MTSAHQLLGFDYKKKPPVIRQSEASECGLACLAMVAASHGLVVDMAILRRQFAVGLRGATVKRLVDIAERIGLSTRALRIETEEITNLLLPAIVHWDMRHFVVVASVKNTKLGLRYEIIDPAQGERSVSSLEFSRSFSGVALEFQKAPNFAPQVAKANLSISQLWTNISGLKRAVFIIFSLSFLLQLTALASPFYLQLALDNALSAADENLLIFLALGFGALAAISALTGWLRATLLLNLSSEFSFQIIDNLYRHLISLPLAWFERRHIGDIVSRFSSTQPITDFLSQGVIGAALDGVLAFATLILMFLYSPLLATIAITAWIVYTLVRVTSFSALRQTNVSSITAAAKENSAFIETVRGASTIKAFGQEGNRRRIWQSLKASAVNAQLRLGRVSAFYDGISGFVIASERIIFVYAAIKLAIHGRLSIGMVFAYQAYKGQFLDAATRLVDQALHFRVISVHLGRISDIVLSSAEGRQPLSILNNEVSGTIELKNISFRYSDGDNFILKNVSLTVNAGESVSFVGPSGGGKSTLIKIMMGLLDPTVGELHVDGIRINQSSSHNWRRHIGSVSQDDHLFAGTLAENIAFFDFDIDMNRVKDACRQASILSEIEAMPLGFESLVGDMGSALSGGQRQRVMLARALYAQPSVLFIDEGTANLDHVSEAAVIKHLSQMTITRIICSHQPHVVRQSSRVFLVSGGTVSELRSEILT